MVIMSTISSKSVKRHDPAELISIVAIIILTLTVAVAPFTANIHNSLNSLAEQSAPLSAADNVVFVSDLQYWNANCSHGWASDSTCSAIVAKTQSCLSSVDSAYCSEYAHYLENFAE
jgi:hypothetical protein